MAARHNDIAAKLGKGAIAHNTERGTACRVANSSSAATKRGFIGSSAPQTAATVRGAPGSPHNSRLRRPPRRIDVEVHSADPFDRKLHMMTEDEWP